MRSTDAPQFAALKRLLQMAEIEFDPPAAAIDLNHLNIREATLESIRHQIHRMLAAQRNHQAQHQRRLLLLRCTLWPQINGARRFAAPAQLAQQADIRAYAQYEVPPAGDDRLEIVVPHKPGVGSDQGLFGKFGQHLAPMVALAAAGG